MQSKRETVFDSEVRKSAKPENSYVKMCASLLWRTIPSTFQYKGTRKKTNQTASLCRY